jgi:hypothetical protein
MPHPQQQRVRAGGGRWVFDSVLQEGTFCLLYLLACAIQYRSLHYSVRILHAASVLFRHRCHMPSLDSYELHVTSAAIQWVKPAVHACHSETTVGCTMMEAGSEKFTCFTCLHEPFNTNNNCTSHACIAY